MKYYLLGLVFLLPLVSQAEVISIVSYDVVKIPKIITVEDKIRAMFPEESRMVAVFTCESGLHQFRANGDPLISGMNKNKTYDLGLSQINSSHWSEAKSLGLDIFHSLEDNLKMARVIYEREGINAWSCNKRV